MQATSNKEEHLTILLMGKHPDEEADRHMEASQEDDTKGEMNKEMYAIWLKQNDDSDTREIKTAFEWVSNTLKPRQITKLDPDN